jgi:hypothetical protein
MREDVRGAQILVALILPAIGAFLSTSGRAGCRYADIFSGFLRAALLRSATQSALLASRIERDGASGRRFFTACDQAH